MTVHNTRRDRAAAARDGIMRHIVGADRAERRASKASIAKAAKQAAPAKAAEPAPDKPRRMKINDEALLAARRSGRAAKPAARVQQQVSPFRAFQPPPGVLPKNKKPIAMDAELGGNFAALDAWAFGAGDGNGALYEEGIGFLGYSYLAQLTQRPEYRRISERIATEMTRKWIELQITSSEDVDADGVVDGQEGDASADRGARLKAVADSRSKRMLAQDLAPDASELEQQEKDGADPEADQESAEEDAQAEAARKKSQEKTKKLRELEDELKRLKVKDAFFNIAEGDGWFGRYHLYFDLKTVDLEKMDAKSTAELKTSIGNGRNATSLGKIRKGFLNAVRCVEPMWAYPATYEARNPLRENFYNPSHWYVNGIEIHRSRFLTFVGREVPDILKPAYAFGGLSMSQMAKPYVDNWLRTRQAVADLIESFSVSGVYTNMQGTLEDGGTEAIKRIELFNLTRANAGAFMLDKDTEEFFNVSTPLGTLDALQAQSQEQMSSVTGIPLIILLGITPTGLNASSEGEIRAFYDWIHAYQESFFRDHLQTVIEMTQLSLWGAIDPEITFVFKPLWSMTDKEEAEIDKIEAETDQVRIDSGVLDPAEVRIALANKPDSRYADINPADVPEPPAQPGMGDGEDGGGNDDQQNEGGSQADSPFGGASDEAPAFEDGAFDEWNEGEHPRADDGKFGSGAGGSSPSKSSTGKKASTAPSQKPALNPSKLKQQGGKLGSNSGGTYTDESGGKYYIKKPASKAHVQNERTAAKLYQLAGAHTLTYRDVDGGEHVATEWQELDKNNIAKFTPAERKEATKDFAVHAWLSNWDAAGLGGDNQGILKGKNTTLDVGGSLRYRAQGGPKGGAFGDKVTEIDTLRDAGMNPDAARLFGKMSDQELKESVQRVTSIPDSKIRATVGDDTELADRLIARKRDMAKRFGTELAQDSDEALMAGPRHHHDLTPADDYDDGLELDEVAPDVFVAQDENQFDESKHKRDGDGKFSSTGGGGDKPDDKKKSDDPFSPEFWGDKPDSSAAKPSFKTKKEHIAHLLTKGVTPKELMQTMGWPSVSMPAQAKSLGMKLEKYVDGGVQKYKGIPMTAEELAAQKKADAEKAAGKKTDEAAQQILKNAGLDKPTPKPKGQNGVDADYKPPQNYGEFLEHMAKFAKEGNNTAAANLLQYNPAWAEMFNEKLSASAKTGLAALAGQPAPKLGTKPKPPQATEAELKKASKSTSLPMNASSPEGAKLIHAFNDKYAQKSTEGEALHEKVQDYKDLQVAVKKADADHAALTQKEQAAKQKKAQEQAEAKKKAEAEAKQKELDAKFAADPELKSHYEAMEALFGGGNASAGYISSAKAKLASSGLQAKNPQIRAEDVVPIVAYSGSHYVAVNDQLRSGKMTATQYKFQKSLNAGLDKLPLHGKTTYRKASLTPEQASLYEPGYIIEERGFMSTSKSQSTWSGSHQFIVHGKNGRDISGLSSHPGEKEVLFKSGTRFEVVSKNGQTIELREV